VGKNTRLIHGIKKCTLSLVYSLPMLIITGTVTKLS